MCKLTWFVVLFAGTVIEMFCPATHAAQVETGFYPLTPSGVHVLTGALAPNVRKWYLPQELYYQYGWKGWDYSNYAKENYIRYTDILLEGRRWYDIYGDYITRGWEVYNWTEDQPVRRGSQLRKSPEFSGWFDNILVSRASKGQFYTAVTIGDAIRTTLTPMTFSSPSFNGLQWDFLSDKYSITTIASRISSPGIAVGRSESPGTDVTSSTRLFGVRGTYQLGDFITVGSQYVNAHNGNSDLDFGESSYRGVLSEGQNSGNIDVIVIRLSDDSPEDGTGGAVFYQSKILVDGVEQPAISPAVEGGRLIGGLRRADGADVITLTYRVKKAFEDMSLGNYQNIRKIEFVLVLANDYKVEVTSNLQTNIIAGALGQPVFLNVARARGNVKDGSNQTFVRFMYGLPTGVDVYGGTFEVSDLLGLDLRAEYDMNRRFRRFPNSTMIKHELGQSTSKAYYVTASQQSYPWFGYGEVYSMDPDYTTSFFTTDDRGFIDYSSAEEYTFELVDDNDDQDRFPDWNRRTLNQRSIIGSMEGWDREVFPGYDENNDLISDFNQNQNLQPDYDEPFLKYNVDPPEFLFGLDMNNNGTADRFENDAEADYPYRRDRRGYNFYTGLEVVPGLKVTVGRMNERLLGDEKSSRSNYGLVTLDMDRARFGKLSVMYNPRKVSDDIPEPLVQWLQPTGSKGVMQDLPDPLIAQNTVTHTAYLQFDYTGIRGFNLDNKVKFELYDQRGSQAGLLRDQRFLGTISKADYQLQWGKDLSVWPKWKSMYRHRVPSTRGQIEAQELSEVLMVIAKYALLEKTWLEFGTEYTFFTNFIEKPVLPPSWFVDDYRGLVLASQFSNTTDYLGYQLTGDLGFRWERRKYEDQLTIGTTFFARIYAGAQR